MFWAQLLWPVAVWFLEYRGLCRCDEISVSIYVLFVLPGIAIIWCTNSYKKGKDR